MAGRLNGKVALVTGGTSGIGAGTARRLAADGATVVFTGSKVAPGEALAEEIGGLFVAHRVEDAAGWPGLMKTVLGRFGRLDIAFANAGTEKGDANIEDVDFAAWSNLVAINQTGVMLTVQHAIRAMAKNEDATGSIIVNASMNAIRPLGNYVTYSTTKAAIVALAKSAAVYCGQKRYRIRVNAILPGVVETEMIRHIMESQPDPAAVRAIYEGMAPLNRMAQVEEVAALVSYLAGDEAGFISGAEITIDGATTAGMLGV